MVIRGQRHSASIEQIILAIDELKGSTDWRKRALGGDEIERKHHYLYDLVNLTLICNEGRGERLVETAIAAGAGGATISKWQYLRFDSTASDVSPARNETELIIDRKTVDPVIEALQSEGVFEPESAGVLLLKPVNLACTHLSVDR